MTGIDAISGHPGGLGPLLANNSAERRLGRPGAELPVPGDSTRKCATHVRGGAKVGFDPLR